LPYRIESGSPVNMFEERVVDQGLIVAAAGLVAQTCPPP